MAAGLLMASAALLGPADAALCSPRMPPAVAWRSPIEESIAARIAAVNRRAPADEIARAVMESGRDYGLDPLLILAVIEIESRYNPSAVGALKERGLMQIRRGTAKGLGLTWSDAFQVRANIDAGSRYLATHVEKYGDIYRAAARYNGGSREYARRVRMRYASIAVAVSGALL